MIRRPAVIVAALALVAAGAVQCFGTPSDDLLTVGKKAFADGQYTLAVSSFQRLQDEFPDSPGAEEAVYLTGVSLYYSGLFSQSLAAFSLLGIRHPQSRLVPRSAYWVGAASLKLGNYKTAYENLDQFLQSQDGANPYRQSCILFRAVALEGLGRDKEAAAGYREMLRDPQAGSYAAEATYRLAGTELRAGNYDSARDLYGKVLLSSASSPFVRDSLFFDGECELALGNPAEAEKRYRTVLSLYQDSPYLEASTFRLADVSWRLGRPTALGQVNDFLDRFPGGSWSGRALRLRADILFGQKKFEDSASDYARAAVLLPDGTERQAAWYGLGRAQLALAKKLDAADAFRRAGSGGSPEVAEKAGFQRAVILAGEGKVQEAIDALRAFLGSFPHSARAEEAGRLLGTLLEKQGDRESSRPVWDSLARSFPASAFDSEYVYRRGMTLLASGNWAPALDDFQKVLKDHAGSPWAGPSAYAIGYVYAQRGEYPRALPFFQSSTDPQGGFSAAICLFDMGRFDKALSAFLALQAAGTAAASAGTIGLYAGRSLYRMGRLPEAAARFADAAAALAAEGSSLGADAHYWRGWALLRLRKPAEAYSSFLAVAEGYPSDPRRLESLFRAGVCEVMQSDDAAAVVLFEQVTDTAPHRGSPGQPGSDTASGIVEQAMYERAMALSRLSRGQESSEALEALARDFPSGRLAAQAFYAKAEKARSEQRYLDAHEGFDLVTRRFPLSPLAGSARYWSAETLLQNGDARGAADAFWTCLVSKDGPGLQAQAIDGFAAALHQLGDSVEARTYAEKARTTAALGVEASSGVRLAAADILLSSAPEEALAIVDDVRRAAPPEPFSGEASLLTGKYAALHSDWGRSLDILGALETSRADDIGARAALEKGRTLEAMGRTADAVDEYLKVAYLFPDFADRGAEGMANAARLSRERGDTGRASQIEQALRKSFPSSPWLQTFSQN